MCLSRNNISITGTTTVPPTTTRRTKQSGLFSDVIRLPRFVLPIHYDLVLKVDLHNKKFSGSVNITVSAESSTAYIIFHRDFRREGYGVDNSSIYVESLEGKERIKIIKQSYISLNYFHILHLQTNLTKNKKYLIKIGGFHGKLEKTLKALYLSSYKTNKGETRDLASSQLQPTDARNVFPCFDEPDMKATFRTTIIHQEEYTALSNMPVVKTSWHEGGWIKDEFDVTPIMSTYILAFVVADFEYKETIFENGYQLRLWAQPDMINQTDLAMTIATECYKYFTDFFGIEDVVPKADHVAVPDFSGGAMENWGLVLYRETSLLYDPEVSTSANKYMVTLIVAHEVAHTWYGNMATMTWWDDLWLNEGFASLLMYFAMGHMNPRWNVFDMLVVEKVFPVMVKDALPTSHPVSTPITLLDDITQTFDEISYIKGMAILRMMEGYIGWDNFRKGLQMYVQRYKYKNAKMDDVWDTFTEAVNGSFDIKEIMDTWTRQMGYPLVSMRTEGDKYILEQSHFLLDPDMAPDTVSSFGYQWHIPFTYITQEDNNVRHKKTEWIKRAPASIPKTSNGWVVGNVGCVGFYLVNYDIDMWRKLAKQLNDDHLVFPETNRGSLVWDALQLARASILDYDLALNMTTYLKNEKSYGPWKSFLYSLQFIRGMLSKDGNYVLLQKYMQRLVAPVFETIGLSTNGTLPERYLRRIIMQTACDVRVRSAVAIAKDMFNDWMKNGTQLPSDYAVIIYSVGIREGGVEEWDYLWKKSQSSHVASEKQLIMNALAQTQKPWLLWRYADWVFDGDRIKTQDVRLVIGYFAESPLGRMIAFHFLMTRWNKLNERFGGDTFLLREIIGEVTSHVNTEFELNQLETLFEEYPPKIARKEADNALALIRANIKWMKNNYDVIVKWLYRHLNETI
ncbi:hypothetical protein ScPMuIL_002698 [Solemya velum]